MFKMITKKEDYIKSVDVSKLPITYDDKMKVNLFGHEVLLEKNEWMWHLHLKLTNACNAKCSFCVEQNSKCKEDAKLFVSQVDKMLAEMKKEGILYSVSVTGGEPLLFKEFEALCKVLSKYDIKFLTMNTNGKYLMDKIDLIDGLFDFVNISRHSIDDTKNREIFKADVPTISELKEIKEHLKSTKMRIQCVMCDIHTIEDFLDFVNTLNFADDLSFRKLMNLSDKHGVKYDDNKTFYDKVLDYAYDNFEFKEQTIQDYYTYEIWHHNNVDITFSYSNMKLLYDVEEKEDDRIVREFIIHPNGIVSGSWDYNNKVILRG